MHEEFIQEVHNIIDHCVKDFIGKPFTRQLAEDFKQAVKSNIHERIYNNGRNFKTIRGTSQNNKS